MILFFCYLVSPSTSKPRKRQVWKKKPSSEHGGKMLWVRDSSFRNVLNINNTADKEMISRGFVRKLGSDRKTCVWVPPENVRGIDAPFDMAAVASLDFRRKVIIT